MTTFVPYRAGARAKGPGTGWRKRQDDAAQRLADQIDDANDPERERIRAERRAIIEANRAGEEAERAALAVHEFIGLPPELVEFIQSGRARRSFVPHLLDALARYLAENPQFRPQTIADSIPDPMSQAEFLARREARAALAQETPPSLDFRILSHVGEAQSPRRGPGRPRKVVETTNDGAILEDD